jgi:hypothetical protein
MPTLLNVEAGVLKRLKALRLAKGDSESAATAWATSHQAAGVARVNAVLALPEHRNTRGEGHIEAANADLKAWAMA